VLEAKSAFAPNKAYAIVFQTGFNTAKARLLSLRSSAAE
jgi:hypothetical protein